MDRSINFCLLSTKTPLFVDRSINFCLLSTKTPLFVDSVAKKARGKQKDSVAKPQKIAPSRFTSGGHRNSDMKHRITKR